MFGYVKPKKEELLVKDWMLYRAVYCGLCREIKKNVSFTLSFGLSYDFVFLAIARDMLTDANIEISQGRCPYNPFKRRAFVHSDGIVFASRMALMLTEKNLDDKIRDRDAGLLSPFVSIAQKHLKRREKKLFRDSNNIVLEVSELLKKYNELEQSESDCDTLATAFGKVLGCVAAHGLDKDMGRIAEALGRSVGAWLYLADATDDIDSDFKKGNFNPLLLQYSTPDGVRAHFDEIDVTFGSLARDAHLALSLIPNNTFGRIADNILSQGLGQEAYNIMNKRRNK